MLKERFFFKLVLGAAFLLWSPLSASAGNGLVALDPGHGGWDSGAVGPTGFAEKTANLDIALRARGLLAQDGYQVILTRTTDISPNTPARDLTGDGVINVADDLQARVDIANNAKADVFVSIHNNAWGSSAHGTETYYWSGLSPDADSAKLAQIIQQEVKAQVGLYDRGVKSANFYVLRRTNMPSALLEGAFISNPTEEALLKSPGFRQQVAQGVANGVKRFVGPPGSGPNEISLRLNPRSRRVVNLNAYFRDQAIGSQVTASRPITAERAVYFNSNGLSGGSSSRGALRAGRIWYLAEGYTGPGFDTWVLLANPRSKSTVAKVRFYVDGRVISGGTVAMPPRSRRTIYVNSILPNRSFATKVTASAPIVVDRSMYFRAGGRDGGHSSPGVQKPASSWYFAEGGVDAQSDTWLLLFNPGAGPAHARLNFLTRTGETIERAVDIPARSRRSIHLNDVVPNSAVSTAVLSDVKIIAERSVYFDRYGVTGGYNSVGVVNPARNWYFADGSTKIGFKELLTVQNPNAAPATVAVDYITRGYIRTSARKIVPGRASLTIDAGEASEAGAGKNLGVRLTANLPVLAERSIYFNTSMYRGGSDSYGSRSPAKRWLFAEGFTGSGFNTSLLLTNTNDGPVDVKVRFFK